MNRFLLFCLSGLLALNALVAHASVDPTDGTYRTEVTDISVKVIGGMLSIDRSYQDNEWRFMPAWSALRFEYDALDGSILRIDRAGDDYGRVDSGSTLYRFDERLTINRTADGWRWQDKDGNWVDYAADGKALRFGNRAGNTVTLAYEGEHLKTITDPAGREVYTLTWTGDQLTQVNDYSGREVKYAYTDGLLTTVTDVHGFDWTYEYSGGRLSKLSDPLGHATTITLTPSGRAGIVTGPTGAITRYTFDYLKAQKQYYLKTVRENGELQEVTEV